MMPLFAILLLLVSPSIAERSKSTDDSLDLENVVKAAHKILSKATRAPDDTPLAQRLKKLGIGWVDPTPENIRKAVIDAMARDSSRAEAKAALDPSQAHAEAYQQDSDQEEEVEEYQEDQEVLVNDSMPTSESSLPVYAYYTISIAIIVVATCCYGGTVVEKLKETSRRVFERIDLFNRLKNGQLTEDLHEKEVECEQLRDANGVLNESLEAVQERLRSAGEKVVELEELKERAALREAAMNSEVESLRSVAEEFAQNERLLQDHYTQSRAISRRKEAALKERLDEQCLISESLNDAVEDMQRLISTMIDANEAIATGHLQVAEADTAPDRNVATEAALPDIPVDPMTNAVQAEAAAPDHDAVQRFVTTVYMTLYSLPHGYDSLAVLLRDLSEDSGLNGEDVARELGYASFETFLQSPEMAPRIRLGALPNGQRFYKVYPTKADLERYVTQQLGTDYGDTRRALARQREENNRLRRQLASTMERVEKLKSEALARKPALDASNFKKQSTKNRPGKENKIGTFPGTDPASRFRPTSSTMNVDGPGTSRDAYDRPASPSRSCQALPEASALSLEVRNHIDELERMVHCAICMDRPKDTAFVCGHVYCHECAVELGKCTFGCKKENGKPLTFKYRVFL